MSQGHAGATIAALSMAMLVVGVGVAALAITRPPPRPAIPDVGAIRAAYAAAAAETKRRHSWDLVIESAECYPFSVGNFMCQVSYIHRDAPNGRVYFDVVALTPNRSGWTLLSGLCRSGTRI